MIKPARKKLPDIFIGRDYSQTLNFKSSGAAMNLTGYTITCQVRKEYDHSSDLLATMTVTVSTPATGVVVLSLTDTVTGAMEAGQGYYDLRVVEPGGAVYTYLYGEIPIREVPTNA